MQNTLQKFFRVVICDFIVDIFSMDGHLEYQLYADICDPVSKIIFNFPNEIWHNSEVRPVSNKEKILKDNGWTFINVEDANNITDQLRKDFDILAL